MKKFIYIALVSAVILNGCQYHPFYDGQSFRVYSEEAGIINGNGENLIVPIVDENPYVIECYGGKGKNHNVTVSDPDMLDFVYEKAGISSAVFDNPEIRPATVTLLPNFTGETSITIEDLDTGESIQMFVTITDSYQAIEVTQGNDTFAKGILFMFRYGGSDDVVKICRGSVANRVVEPVVDATYRFVAEDNELYGDVLFFEITYPADEAGRPSAGGMETFKRYLIGYERYGYGSARWQMELLNLRSFPLATKAVEAPEYKYYVTMRFVDVTDIEDLVITERFYSDHFKAESAQLLPWNF